MRLSDKNAMQYYLTEAAANNWSGRTLDRNISTLYYQRLLSSQKKDLVIAEMQEKTADFQQDKLEFIKNPAVLEFLGLPNICRKIYALSAHRGRIDYRNRTSEGNVENPV
jgi:predicted nuclease of restriction endonuclease-like (RecB) superfamily